MKRASVNLLTLLMLLVITGFTLILNLPSVAAINEYAQVALVYSVLTTFTLYFGMLLSEGELSAAHVVGMVAFLSLPRAAQPVILWAIFLGGLAGGLLLVFRQEEKLLRRPLTVRTARSAVTITARVTLSFLAAGQFYLALQGTLPLGNLTEAASVPLLIFAVLYILVYLAVFLLESYADGHAIQRILRDNWTELFAILVLPVPFGIVSALLIVTSQVSLVMFIIGMAALTLGLYGLSRAQHQFRKQLDESRSLAVVSQAMQSNLDLDALLRTVYDQVAGLLNPNQFLVALYRGNQQLHFPLAIQDGQPYVPPDDDHRSTLLQHVLWTQKPLLLQRQVQQQAVTMGLTPPNEAAQSWLGVPLLAGGRLLGAMVAISNDPLHHFKPDDLRLLTTVAASASVAIDNAQLYATQTARAEQLSMLNRVLSLLTVTLSPDAVLDAVVSSASLISEATGIAVYLSENEKLALVRVAGLSDDFSANPPELLTTDFRQKPVMVGNVFEDTRTVAQRDILRRELKAAMLEIPLVVGETGVGVLVLYYAQPRGFSEAGIEIIRVFANQAAQAIKNARQYSVTDRALERRAEQMYALVTMGRQLTAPMPAADICNLVLRRALDHTQADAGLVVMKEEKTGQPELIAETKYPSTTNLTPYTLLHSLVGQALQAGHGLLVADTRRGASPPLLPNAQSQIAVPIIRETKAIGVLVLESTHTNAFHDEDLHFLTQLANHTTIAIDNSRLFAHVAEARDRLQVILNAMTEAIILVDKTGTVVLANPRVELIGLSASQLTGEKINDLLADSDLKLVTKMGFESGDHLRVLLQELQAPDNWLKLAPQSYNLETEHGPMAIERAVLPISPDGEPIGVLLVFYDVTEEHELAQMRDDLSRMIVHDLRSPLTAVTTGLKLLREVIPANNPYRGIVESTTETSQRAIRKLLSRVDSLLDISRMESGQLTLDTEPTELANLVDSVCIELSPLAHELEVILNSELDDALPLLNVDSDKIERVIQNLVDNALKYSPAETTITIRSYPVETHDAPANFIRVEVVDQGPGVPEEYKSKLFERFAQIKGRRGTRRGIGLGLTFCKMAVEAHGGRIWIEDNPGGGSIFAFTLPVTTTRHFDETGEWPAVSKP